jgi:AraC family transcriptional regulator, regulatory protein of adaptative response / methylated-DNA-[protein]-cysteine methyltransferase
MFSSMTAAPSLSTTPASRWRVVLARDRRYDGRFVYAVRSTGVYCRPSCPSRRPRRAQVAFFAAPADAEAAGFRACRRCHPRDAATGDPAAALVRAACAHLDVAPERRLAPLARELGASPFQLTRAFRRVLGVTPRQYRDARRRERLRTELKRRKHVGPAVYEAGFGSSSRVYERADDHLGMTPKSYGRGAPGITIHYAAVPSPLGRLLVGATARGVCFVSLGDALEPLERALKSEFPAARLQRDTHGLGRWTAAIVRHLEGRAPQLDVPLDVQATAFQRRVWEELQKIPYGQTRSYGEVARRIGRPQATRAVAQACATNPAAIVIPCHRVVRADGDLGGYRWGVERKRALLKREAAP